MTPQEKTPYFEYFTKLLVDWHSEKTGNNTNDLSTLKVLKLLFFASAVNTKSDSQDTLLDTIFDKYYAMPYGHVESDIYTSIRTGSLTNVTINNRNSIIHSDIELPSEKLKKDIDNAVGALKASNPNIILASSFDLVDLSHSWYSWQYYYGLAKRQRVNSIPIPVSDIKEEEKIFML
tara:strand:+ start:846 stop:1376 length:531 start_codon:yes stop_codon:yes gene_type:complete